MTPSVSPIRRFLAAMLGGPVGPAARRQRGLRRHHGVDRGDRDDAAEACLRVAQSGVHILGPECAVPLITPIENLRGLVDVVEGRC